MKLKKIKLDLINIEVAPESEQQQASLIETEQNEDPIQLRLNGNGKYDVIDGRRRVIDTQKVGRTWVWAIVRENVDDTELALKALILNSGTPNYMDEADHVYKLVSTGITLEVIARKTNCSVGTLQGRLKLKEKLIPELQECLRAGKAPSGIKVSYSMILELCRLSNSLQQLAYHQLCNGDKFTQKMAQEMVRQYQSEVSYADLQIPMLTEEQAPEFRPGLFVTGETMRLLLSGNAVGIEYQGKSYKLSLHPQE